MYQGRSSNAQKKTRSPAPQTATPRSFLPPSYYPSVAAQSPIIRGDNWNGDQVSDRQDTRKTRRVSRNHPAVLSSDSSASSVEQHLRAKSRTPRTGFPDVETQLLPSLRETVDRMTLTPAWNPPYPQSTETDARQKVSRTGAKPAVASSSYLQSTPKPTLKSAMRSPVPTPTHTPKLQSPLVPQKSSLRSLLSRKCSGTLKSPFNNNKPSKVSLKQYHIHPFLTTLRKLESLRMMTFNLKRPLSKLVVGRMSIQISLDHERSQKSSIWTTRTWSTFMKQTYEIAVS